MNAPVQDGIVARFQFLPDRASEFSETGSEIVEMLFNDVSELEPFVMEFHDAIVDAVALVNGKVVPVSRNDSN